jgi:putative heme-binding domain-containing protein
LWGLHVTGGLSESEIGATHLDRDPHVRGWGIQLALEGKQPGASVLNEMKDMARRDESPVVRRFIVSGLLRLAPEQRWDILPGLLSQSADIDDHNLPLMNWYAAEPLAAIDAKRALALAGGGSIPLVQEFMIRRVGAIGTPETLDLLVLELGAAKEPAAQLRFLRGIQAALRGRRQVPMPASWPAHSEKLRNAALPAIRTLAFSLAVTFGDPAALVAMRDLLAKADTPVDQRKEYLATLLSANDAKLVPVLHALLKEPSLRAPALRGLAAFDDAQTPSLVLAQYAALDAAEKRDALATLTSRAAYARVLLTAIGEKQLPATDLSADLVRQLRNLRDEKLNEQIAAVWGIVRDTAEDKAKLIAEYTKLLAARPATESELPLGRAVFAKACQQCHALFGSGGKIGPELTGSNRANLEYLLSNVLDPSAVMSREYIPHVIETKGGRVITGLVREQTPSALSVVTANETVIVPRDEIAVMVEGKKSMMPDDLLKPLSEDEVRALVGYLASPRQTALLAKADNLTAFFNGKDLTGWDGNSDLWRVENGEIVGTSKGLRRNEFLISQLLLADFRLSLDVKLVPNEGNSGIQFRSEPLPEGEVKGYQADVGVGWWGKLYEEHGRELLWKESGEAHVKPGDWNRYEIVASGSRIRTSINGKPCVDLDDPQGAKRGIIAFQLHSGGAFEVRYRNLKLELDPPIATGR